MVAEARLDRELREAEAVESKQKKSKLVRMLLTNIEIVQ